MAAVLDALFVSLWSGGLWIVGFLVAPLLFRSAPDRQVAGDLAGTMFTAMSYVGLASATYLLCYRLARFGLGAMRRPVFWVIVVMAMLTAGGQFGIQPILSGLKAQAFPREVMESVFRDRFATWHGVASILYVVESVLAAVLVVVAGRQR
ncbi:MAG: DUF4149 domain-containing protein [Betaproteobacteria bacterium]|nr:DUF4149 domain-containing protein [Betaproteobacteria bacterium]